MQQDTPMNRPIDEYYDSICPAALANLQGKAYLSILQWVFLTGICRSTTYQHITAGSLKTLKVGKRRLIPASEVKDFFIREGVA